MSAQASSAEPGSIPGSVVLSCCVREQLRRKAVGPGSRRAWAGSSLLGLSPGCQRSSWPAHIWKQLCPAVKGSWAGRSGLDARALETSPGPADTPSEQGRKAKEKEKNRKRKGGWGLRGEWTVFCSEEPLAFPNKSENPQGEAIFSPGPPTSESDKLRYTYVFVSKRIPEGFQACTGS